MRSPSSSPHHWDLAEFLRNRDQGRRAERLGRGAEAAAAYEAAVALYMGDLLPEPLFRDVAWLYHLRAACREDMLSMRTFLAEHAAAAHDWPAALIHWKAILQVEPAREVVHARMMTVYAWLGAATTPSLSSRSAAPRYAANSAPIPCPAPSISTSKSRPTRPCLTRIDGRPWDAPLFAALRVSFRLATRRDASLRSA